MKTTPTHSFLLALALAAVALPSFAAEPVNIARLAGTTKKVVSGSGVGGTICQLISEEAKNTLDTCDVILAKGQGNYESLAGHGRHIYYSFLCKCDLFVRRFNVPKFTGMFIME